MILFRLISWPDARKHVLRSLLAVGGITLGVAIFIAMSLANRSVLSSFSQTVDKIAGSTELQVSGDEAGFDEGILDKVQAVQEVDPGCRHDWRRQPARLPSLGLAGRRGRGSPDFSGTA